MTFAPDLHISQSLPRLKHGQPRKLCVLPGPRWTARNTETSLPEHLEHPSVVPLSRVYIEEVFLLQHLSNTGNRRYKQSSQEF